MKDGKNKEPTSHGLPVKRGWKPCGCHTLSERVVRPCSRYGLEQWYAQACIHAGAELKAAKERMHFPFGSGDIGRWSELNELWQIMHEKHVHGSREMRRFIREAKEAAPARQAVTPTYTPRQPRKVY